MALTFHIFYLFIGELFRFDLDTRVWIQHTPPFFFEPNGSSINNMIPSRSGHQWSYLPSTHSILVFGGHGNENRTLGVTKHTIAYDDSWMLYLDGCKGHSEGNECHKNESHGYCHFQFCICTDDYWGTGCEYDMCLESECSYDNHTLERECTFCSGHGTCNQDGTCTCDDGYTGPGCEELWCLNDCLDRGNCTEIAPGDVQCVCQEPYIDIDCGKMACPRDCFGRGVCDDQTGICDCDDSEESGREFKQPDCALTVYPSGARRIETSFDWLALVSIGILICMQ